MDYLVVSQHESHHRRTGSDPI